jgi:hypothetical protein
VVGVGGHDFPLGVGFVPPSCPSFGCPPLEEVRPGGHRFVSGGGRLDSAPSLRASRVAGSRAISQVDGRGRQARRRAHPLVAPGGRRAGIRGWRGGSRPEVGRARGPGRRPRGRADGRRAGRDEGDGRRAGPLRHQRQQREEARRDRDRQGRPFADLLDEDGRQRAHAAVTSKDSSLDVTARARRTPPASAAQRTGALVTAFAGECRRPRGSLGVIKDASYVGGFDEQGNDRTKLEYALESSSAGVGAFDDNRKVRLLLVESPKGHGAGWAARGRTFGSSPGTRARPRHSRCSARMARRKPRGRTTRRGRGRCLPTGAARCGRRSPSAESGAASSSSAGGGASVGEVDLTKNGFAGMGCGKPEKQVVMLGISDGSPKLVITDKGGRRVHEKP